MLRYASALNRYAANLYKIQKGDTVGSCQITYLCLSSCFKIRMGRNIFGSSRVVSALKNPISRRAATRMFLKSTARDTIPSVFSILARDRTRHSSIHTPQYKANIILYKDAWKRATSAASSAASFDDN